MPDVTPEALDTLTECSVRDCNRPLGGNNRDLCGRHFANLVRHGHPRRGPQPRNIESGDGLLARVVRRLRAGS